MMKTLLLLMVLLFTMATIVNSAPTAVGEITLDEILINSASDISGTSAILAPLNSTTTTWVPGEPQSIFIEMGARDIYYTFCVPKSDDRSMCIVTFLQSNDDGRGYMWVYDNMCREVGNKRVTRAEMADRYSMSSELPMFVDVNIDRKWSPYNKSGVKLWYGSHYNKNPLNKATQHWPAQTDSIVLQSNWPGRLWSASEWSFDIYALAKLLVYGEGIASQFLPGIESLRYSGRSRRDPLGNCVDPPIQSMIYAKVCLPTIRVTQPPQT
ncbi:uncharacterized protein RCO7_11417 [Rhynchosporium graminicola]|uniref:Uncharacterized protein n=1 Tax=Rhynchosporium graminicola TaxID=2792576 RepID=A0A1E1LEZ6_9HELO|nr:uncharacterized protein RCO7_11417 [Rhynchosporium commune]